MQEVKFNYSGKNFVVVGSASGMGKQIATELATAGAKVFCLDLNLKALEEMSQAEFDGDGQIVPGHVDVAAAKPSDWDALLKNFVKEHGKISGGVYTAATSGLTIFRRWNEELAQSIMATSYWGMLRFMQAVTKRRIAEDGSSFVLFSSDSAHTGESGLLVYASTKRAVQTAMKVMAKELSQFKHRINTISPGWVAGTGMSKDFVEEFGLHEKVTQKCYLGLGSAEKVSGMVLFLLSNRADWITGTDVVVDGGYLLGDI